MFIYKNEMMYNIHNTSTIIAMNTYKHTSKSVRTHTYFYLPDNKFDDSDIFQVRESEPKILGIVPTNLFPDKSRNCNFESVPIDRGSVPPINGNKIRK